MNYPTRKDPVVMDELAYERQCEANQVRMERCREAAQKEYDYGDLDTIIKEYLIDDNPNDLAHLALEVITGLDTDDMELSLSRVATEIASIRSTIDGAIELRAEEMYQSGENY